jgi:hypothetical protein
MPSFFLSSHLEFFSPASRSCPAGALAEALISRMMRLPCLEHIDRTKLACSNPRKVAKPVRRRFPSSCRHGLPKPAAAEGRAQYLHHDAEP